MVYYNCGSFVTIFVCVVSISFVQMIPIYVDHPKSKAYVARLNMRLAKPQPEPKSFNLIALQGAKIEPRKRKVVPV